MGRYVLSLAFCLFSASTIELKLDATTVSGVIRRVPGPPEPIQIFDGNLNGNTMTFKVKSPDGLRTVTFVGTLSGDEIVFRR